MHIEFVGRHFEVTAKLRAEATAYLERILPIVPKATTARIILTEDRYRRIAEVELLIPGGDLVAKCEEKDMEKALHDALRRVEQQAVKHSQRDQTLRDGKKPVVNADGDLQALPERLNSLDAVTAAVSDDNA